jgi:copper(I)-binding protein
VNARRSIATAVAVMALPLGLAACGFDAQTNKVYNPTVGVNNQEGQVDALNVVIVTTGDAGGTLVASLANNDQSEADTLTGVTGEGVQVEISGDTQIPAGGLLTLDDGSLRITGEAVRDGAFVTLTFAFERAAAVTVKAPVVLQDSEGDYADVPVA